MRGACSSLLRLKLASRSLDVWSRAASIRTSAMSSLSNKQHKQALVIGGGFAGISAARKLQQRGVDVTVLEAEDCIGGRARSVQLLGCGIVEFGCTWLHGLDPHPLYELALEHGIMTGKEERSAEKVWGQSAFVRQGGVQPLNEEQTAIAAAATAQYSAAVEEATEIGAKQGYGHSMGDYIRQAFAKAYAEQRQHAGPEAASLFAEAWAWREMFQRAMEGCRSTDDLSARAMYGYEELEGPHMPMPGGYQALAEKAAEGLDVRLGQQVTRVAWGDSGATLQCADGSSWHADAVVVTVSLGVLKARHQQLFDPPLPLAKVDAIARLGMGVVDKVFIDFTEPGIPAEAPDTQQPTCSAASSRAAADHSSGAESTHEPLTSSDSTRRYALLQADAAPGPADQFSYCMLYHVDAGTLMPQGSGQHGTAQLAQQTAPLGAEQQAAEQQRSSSPVRGAGDREAAAQELVAAAGSSSQQTPTGWEAAGKLPSWARGFYTLRFWGSEVVRGHSAELQRRRDMRLGVIWIMGDEAAAMEARSDAELHRDVQQILEAFPAICLPKRFTVHRSCWGRAKNFRGSWSYPSAAVQGGECQALAAPLRDAHGRPVVSFAGEACSTEYFGCTHGAWLTGEAAADVLLETLQ